ncbi:SpoIIE family protein phosphatase [Streptomyces sp. NPDC053069]|uniref:SpoIIE family protein phosphatase n=1 Tax=Streptomyces sp. NPDC053069 TaxID=3365695 RepID=UPI0037D3B82A
MVLGTDLVIADANPAFCEVTGRSRAELLGQYLFDTFPDNPADPEADGLDTLKASLRRVLSSGQTDHMALQKYDIPVPGDPEVFKERWWTAINVTDVVRSRRTAHLPSVSPGREAAMEAELQFLVQMLQLPRPPPVLLHPDGSCDLLGQATDPPRGARPEHVPRPQANATYTPGDTLILYTDGLIERRDEDMDAGLTRLTSTLTTCTEFGAEHLADALLARFGVASGAGDDIAIVVVRLDRTPRPY